MGHKVITSSNVIEIELKLNIVEGQKKNPPPPFPVFMGFALFSISYHCLSFCHVYRLAIVLSVLLRIRIMTSDYPFDIFKLFSLLFVSHWISNQQGPSCLYWIYNYLCNQCLSSLMWWVRISIRARCTTLCDKVCQWLVTGRWFSPVSSYNKTDCYDIPYIQL